MDLTVSSFVSQFSLLTAQGVNCWVASPHFVTGIICIFHSDWIDYRGALIVFFIYNTVQWAEHTADWVNVLR